MKKRTALGGMIAGAVLLGVILSKLIPGFHFGVGSGGSSELSPSDLDATNVMVSVPATNEASTTTDDRDDTAATPLVLDVLIDGHAYAIRRGGQSGDYEPIDLAALVEEVKKTPGNDEGIRIRIARTESARASTEINLQDALEAAGIKETAISWRKQLIE